MKMNGAEPLRVLVVEDDMMVSMLIEDMLVDLGCTVVGPHTRVSAALDAARAEDFDAAVLDLNLHGENSFPIAWTLRERGIPFVFATGYGPDILGPGFANNPLLRKPFQKDALRRALDQAREQAAAERPSIGLRR
jgi:CheY-like chemotaxis protein